MNESVPLTAEFRAALMKEKERRECEKSLAAFIKSAWSILEPGTEYIHGWHIDVICEHLEAVTRGEIRKLLINIPPRHSKSGIVSVMWPCWEWITRPHEKYLCASYASTLSIRDCVAARRLITSPWYQGHWGERYQLSEDQNQKSRISNTMTGHRIATSVGSAVTGDGGSRLLLDDPNSAQEAQSDLIRESSLEWFDTVWSTRLNNPKRDAMITIMQRLHEKDVSGRILELGGWEHICLPAEYDMERRTTKLGPYDPRKERGELLWPERFGQAELDSLKISLGAYGTAGQLQQQPSPEGGGIIRVGNFKLWPNKEPIPPLEYVLQSYDTAFTEKTSGDPTACSVWGIFTHEGSRQVMLIDCWAEHLAYPDLRKKVLTDWNVQYAGNSKDPMNKARRPDLVLIEEKGSGQSLIQDLRKAKVMVAPYNPGRADKVSRAHVVAPILESGVVWVPESKVEGRWTTWANEFMLQLSRFPAGEHDDFVDTMTQALRYLHDARFFDLQQTKRYDHDDLDKKYEGPRVNPYAV